jgi:UDP-N-acetylmuramoyl-L-alanyl-D-glutamate--2,6-diaminopimelate ligase
MHHIKKILTALIPSPILTRIISWYHYTFAHAAALWYGYPGKKLFIVGITGTKGKSTAAEIMNHILETAGYKTLLAGTIRFKIGDHSTPNVFKMTMPGRGYLQKCMRDAVNAGCTHAVIEITSEGAKQYRNVGIPLNALMFTSFAPEHIESHGSLEKYKQAKLSIGHSLVHSPKRPRILVAHKDNDLGPAMLALPVETSIGYTNKECSYTESDGRLAITLFKKQISVPLEGAFNVNNVLGAARLAEAMGISAAVIEKALETIPVIKGRVEHIHAGQTFSVVVDYAHTPDSLKALYGAFAHRHTICVLGNTGGGRDTWKRPEMAAIAETSCKEVILTNEDPYDEDPMKILGDMAGGMTTKPTIILDRRSAIAHALTQGLRVGSSAVVLITGKGTDPYIMEANGKKTPWSDATVATEELKKLLEKTA